MFQYPTNSWNPIFKEALKIGLLEPILENISMEIEKGYTIYPPCSQIFNAFEMCDMKKTKVVLIGQDPYHGEGEANGLCFSVNKGIKTPPSLRNIFKELKNEIPNFDIERSTDLTDWAEQGVLLLNAVLTVRKDSPASHSTYGWQTFTDVIIQYISSQMDFVVFILLGNFAISKSHLIDEHKHKILTTTHPSPFSAYRGFLGSQIFMKCNDLLIKNHKSAINW